MKHAEHSASSANHCGRLLGSVVLGAATGAALALWFAPASGQDTRAALARQATDQKTRARHAVAKGRERLRYERRRLEAAADEIRHKAAKVTQS